MSTPKNNGGPAFPQPNHLVETDHGKMNARDWMDDSGMSLRDWFAGQAMVGLRSGNPDAHPEWIANHAYEQADFMLEVREK